MKTKPPGLNPNQLAIIQKTLQPFANQIKKIALFGSRAKNKFRYNSDIDLVLYGKISSAILARIITLFDESSLAQTVDIVVYDDISDPALKKEIDDHHVPL